VTETTYADCLAKSYAVNWRIEEVLGDRAFDPSRPWLPAGLSATPRLPQLGADDLRRLTQVEMAAYAHLFGYVEEFIAPQMTSLAQDFALGRRDAFDALTNFAAEEVKHMNLFLAVRRRVDRALGFETALVGGREETARFVLSKERAGVLLFTAAIEWMTQRHYKDAISGDGSLDPLTRDVFRAHWLEESQHARLDEVEALRAFDGLEPARRDRAIDGVIEILQGVDGLLQQQSELDVGNFETLRGAPLAPATRAEVLREVLRAKRWTFIESGVTHPRFVELFQSVTTPEQQARVTAALSRILAPANAAGCAAA
jgi:hypothetical protein